jgi:hypothetical protein
MTAAHVAAFLNDINNMAAPDSATWQDSQSNDNAEQLTQRISGIMLESLPDE